MEDAFDFGFWSRRVNQFKHIFGLKISILSILIISIIKRKLIKTQVHMLFLTYVFNINRF